MMRVIRLDAVVLRSFLTLVAALAMLLLVTDKAAWLALRPLRPMEIRLDMI